MLQVTFESSRVQLVFDCLSLLEDYGISKIEVDDLIRPYDKKLVLIPDQDKNGNYYPDDARIYIERVPNSYCQHTPMYRFIFCKLVGGREAETYFSESFGIKD